MSVAFSPYHNKTDRENKESKRVSVPAYLPATSDQQGQQPHPARHPQHLRNHTNKAKQKNKATQSRQPATPKTQTPRTAWGTPTRAYPPPKTPAIEIAGGKQTNNENARHKDTLMIGRTSPNFF
jgi:hypothetical protein